MYAFDIHCNSFFPLFLLLYVLQFFLLPFLLNGPFSPFSIFLFLLLYVLQFSCSRSCSMVLSPPPLFHCFCRPPIFPALAPAQRPFPPPPFPMFLGSRASLFIYLLFLFLSLFIYLSFTLALACSLCRSLARALSRSCSLSLSLSLPRSLSCIFMSACVCICVCLSVCTGGFLATLVSNSLFLVALSYYHYITFLGYSGTDFFSFFQLPVFGCPELLPLCHVARIQ
jgi:hypothetical protein